MYIIKLFVNGSTHNTIICGTIYVQTIDGKIYTFLIWKLWKLYAYTCRKKLQRTRQRHWIEMLLTWWHNNSPRSNVFEKWCTAIKCSLFFFFFYAYSYKVILSIYIVSSRIIRNIRVWISYSLLIFKCYYVIMICVKFYGRILTGLHNICKYLNQNISGIIS